jgi:membrane protein DedA with SNARE-associated domain
MLASAAQTLLDSAANLPPSASFIAIIFATFLLEDVAIVGTGLLASTGVLDPFLGGFALLIGIILGDFGLFGLGRGAAKLPGLRRYVDTRAAQKLRGLGSKRSLSLVFTTRFLPGMRLPTYTGLGYVGSSFWQFFYAVIFAVTAWTVLLYSMVVVLGRNVLEAAGPWKWGVVVALIVGVFFIERRIIKRRRSKLENQHSAEKTGQIDA